MKPKMNAVYLNLKPLTTKEVVEEGKGVLTSCASQEGDGLGAIALFILLLPVFLAMVILLFIF